MKTAKVIATSLPSLSRLCAAAAVYAFLCVTSYVDTALAGASAEATRSTLFVEQILDRAVDRAAESDRQNLEGSYIFTFVSRVEKLNRNREVEETVEKIFENVPIQSVPFSRLVAKDGRRLTEDERRKEDDRELKFRDRLSEARGRHPEDENRIRFDRDLVSRYDCTFVAVELNQLINGGRPAYAVFFQPKDRPLPTSRRIDRAINKARGKLWVDTETYEVARVEFELIDRVKLWWGLVGSISRMTGWLVREPLEENLWAPAQFNIYVKGRALFRSIHFEERLEWSQFQKLRTVG